MDIDKIQFGQLAQSKGIDRAFEDLDVNNDGKINAVDASMLLAYYARVSSGKSITFKAFCAEIRSK